MNKNRNDRLFCHIFRQNNQFRGISCRVHAIRPVDKFNTLIDSIRIAEHWARVLFVRVRDGCPNSCAVSLRMTWNRIHTNKTVPAWVSVWVRSRQWRLKVMHCIHSHFHMHTEFVSQNEQQQLYKLLITHECVKCNHWRITGFCFWLRFGRTSPLALIEIKALPLSIANAQLHTHAHTHTHQRAATIHSIEILPNKHIGQPKAYARIHFNSNRVLFERDFFFYSSSVAVCLFRLSDTCGLPLARCSRARLAFAYLFECNSYAKSLSADRSGNRHK